MKTKGKLEKIWKWIEEGVDPDNCPKDLPKTFNTGYDIAVETLAWVLGKEYPIAEKEEEVMKVPKKKFVQEELEDEGSNLFNEVDEQYPTREGD